MYSRCRRLGLVRLENGIFFEDLGESCGNIRLVVNKLFRKSDCVLDAVLLDTQLIAGVFGFKLGNTLKSLVRLFLGGSALTFQPSFDDSIKLRLRERLFGLCFGLRGLFLGLVRRLLGGLGSGFRLFLWCCFFCLCADILVFLINLRLKSGWTVDLPL